MIAPGRCGACRHRLYCADVGECRPLVAFRPDDPRFRITPDPVTELPEGDGPGPPTAGDPEFWRGGY